MLPACLPVAVDDKLGGGESVKAHGAPGVQLLGADADLRAEAELKAVRKSSGGVHIDCRRVYLLQEPAGIGIIRVTIASEWPVL